MSSIRLHVPSDELAKAAVVVAGPDHRRLAKVLRVRPGDAVTLFDGAGAEVEARVARVGTSETELVLGERRETTAATPVIPLVLLTAVPKGPRMDFLVQKTTELGVSRIVPLITARSVVRPEAGRRARWEKIAREAARQCGRADIPEIAEPVALAAALSASDLPARRLVLWENERAQSLRAAVAAPEPTVVLVGPEGGFAPAEVEIARAAGFLSVGLGPRILRVETAAVVAVALLQEIFGGLG